jgi:acyl-coenzyme A thioesterase PaaI-like protein
LTSDRDPHPRDEVIGPNFEGADAPRFTLRPHNCFACGSLNVDGLRLVLHVEHARAWTEVTLDRRFEGWEGIAHGGILCTILDEVMAWSLVATDNWGLTARMNVAFRKPVPIGRPLRAEGSIVRARRRIHETTSRLIDVETGVTLATADGTYVAADDERKRELRERYLVGAPDRADAEEESASTRPQDARTAIPASRTAIPAGRTSDLVATAAGQGRPDR